jgi:radical SAM superfamily enzyme YgiQ (UPF0313 family)
MNDTLKVAIVITRPGFHSYMVPLGYLYVSASLKHAGFNVAVINASVAPGDQREFVRTALAREQPNVVITGTSYKFHNNCPSSTVAAAREVTRVAKLIDDACRTLLIGPLNCVLESQLIESPSVDALALGEPEEICVAVCRALAAGRDLADVPGLVLEVDGKPLRTGKTDHPDLASMPLPDRDAVDYEQYIRDTYFARRATEMLSSRGCPFNCTYCFGAYHSRRHENNTGKYYRAVPPERVVAEIDLLYHKWGVRGIKFADVEFCVSSKQVAAICELLLAENYKDLHWRAVTRATSVGLDLLRLMHRAGCRHIYYGVESGDPACLRTMDKRVTLDEIREAFDNTRRAGIHPEASFLLGVPGESEASVERTIRFARELDAFAATFHVFVPFPGIPLEKSLNGGGSGNGKVCLDDWDVYRLNVAKSYCEIPAERLDQLSRRAYRRFYLRPRYLARMAASMRNPYMRRFAVDTVLGRHEGGLVRNMVLGVKSRLGLAK